MYWVSHQADWLEAILLAKKEAQFLKHTTFFVLYSSSLEHSRSWKAGFWWEQATQMTNGSLTSHSINQTDLVKETPSQISNYWKMFQEALDLNTQSLGDLNQSLANPTRNLIVTEGDQRDKQIQRHQRPGSCISEKEPLWKIEKGSENNLLAPIKFYSGKHTLGQLQSSVKALDKLIMHHLHRQ